MSNIILARLRYVRAPAFGSELMDYKMCKKRYRYSASREFSVIHIFSLRLIPKFMLEGSVSAASVLHDCNAFFQGLSSRSFSKLVISEHRKGILYNTATKMKNNELEQCRYDSCGTGAMNWSPKATPTTRARHWLPWRFTITHIHAHLPLSGCTRNDRLLHWEPTNNEPRSRKDYE